ncbi:MAG: flippase-like domain-containing protein [Actinomycetota bacterium]|nr:flippase-like domain-containing protein [Actinomycetota bacterium]
MRLPFPRRRSVRAGLAVGIAAAAGALVWWRGPAWGAFDDAFRVVSWHWVFAAIALNLLSVVVRAFAWRAVIQQALPRPHPRFPLVFSAFSVGLMANAVLPGRIGELAHVAVLTRRLASRSRARAWATLVGTVFAHRIFDVVPAMLLIAYVLLTARIPNWAVSSLIAFAAIGTVLLTFAIASARGQHALPLDGLGVVRRLVRMGRHGLAVLRAPLASVVAAAFQCLGWLFQLLAVYTALLAFHLDASLPAAALVLVLMNVATIFPLWPGNVGLTQAAIALPLVSQYGVDYAHAIAFGLGLQAIEASVGIGVGLLFLAREGLSFTMLRVMPDAAHADVPVEAAAAERDGKRESARVPD